MIIYVQFTLENGFDGILNRGERNTDVTLKALPDVIDSNNYKVRRLTDVHE